MLVIARVQTLYKDNNATDFPIMCSLIFKFINRLNFEILLYKKN